MRHSIQLKIPLLIMSHLCDAFSMRAILILAIFLHFGPFLSAPAAQVDPCEKDRAKYCPLNGPKDPFRLYCLKFYESQITPACKGSLRNIKGTSSEFIEECTEDYHKFCVHVREGQGRVLECLQNRSRELDFECRKKVNMMPRR